MGTTVRDISSHSQFGSTRQAERNDAETGEADMDVDRATVQSLAIKRYDSTMQPDNTGGIVREEPVVDQEKIDSIKARINNGTFSINASSIVDKLLQTENLLK